MKKGDICLIRVKSREGETERVRPAVVLYCEQESPVAVVVAITSNTDYEDACNVIKIEQEYLKPESVVLVNHVKTIKKDRIIDIAGCLSKEDWDKVSQRIAEQSI